MKETRINSRVLILLIVIAGASILLFYLITNYERQQREWEAKSQNLLHEFFQAVGKPEGTGIKIDAIERRGFARRIYSREIMYEDFSLVRFSPDEGIVLCYANVEENVPGDLLISDAISKEKALEVAREAFKRLHFGENLPDGVKWKICMETVKLEDTSHNVNVENDLRGASWHVGSTYTYLGTPTKAVARLNISAYSGRIVGFNQIPFRLPDPCNRTVDKSAAIARAEKALWIMRSRLKGLTSAQLCYTYPQATWKDWGPVRNMRLAWEITYAAGADEPPPVVFVDCENGKIIGLYR